MHRPVLATTVALLAASHAMAQGPAPQVREPLALAPLARATVTVLADNMAGPGPVLGEWGLSFFLETDQHRLLFDTGGGRVLVENARGLGVDLGRIGAIILSHGHGDHTGGLEKALGACGPVELFIHPAAFDTRYWKAGSRAAAYSLPLSREQLSGRVRKLVETRGPTMVVNGVMVTGQIPRVSAFEDTGVREYAFLDEALKTPDDVLDDQAVFFRAPEGVVILLGCAHAGLVNTMQYVSELLGGAQIYTVMGGTHLLNASPDRMRETVAALRRYDVQRILLSHCTGPNAYAEIASAFPGRCSWPASGARIEFGRR